MNKIIEYIKSAPTIFKITVPLYFIAIITIVDETLQNYDIQIGWVRFYIDNGLDWLTQLSIGLLFFTFVIAGVYFFLFFIPLFFSYIIVMLKIFFSNKSKDNE